MCQYVVTCGAALGLLNLHALGLPNLPSLKLLTFNPTNLPQFCLAYPQPTRPYVPVTLRQIVEFKLGYQIKEMRCPHTMYHNK